MTKPTATSDDKESDQHGEYRQWLVAKHYEASQAFDRAVMFLAGGALGLSLAFVKDFAPDPTHQGWLGAAWGLLATSLAFTFVSLLSTMGVLIERIKCLDEGRDWSFSWLGWITTALNVLAAVTLLAGVVALVRFAMYNL